MRIYTYLFFLSTVFFKPSLKGQFMAPRFQRLTIAEGLPSNEVHQIREDADGFIWLATSEGICRFDGYKTQLLRGGDKKTSLKVNADRPVYFDWDAQKRWWIGSDWAAVRVYDPIKNKLHYLQTSVLAKSNETPADILLDTLKQAIISTIFFDGQNRIWLGTFHGLQVFDVLKNRMDWNPQLATPLFDNCLIQQMAKDVAGNIWAAVKGKGLCKFDNKTQTWSIVVNHVDVRSFTFNTGLSRDNREGGIFFITKNELRHLDTQSGVTSQSFNASIKGLAMKADFMKIHCDKVGRIWLGTTNGLVVLHGGKIPPQIFKQDPRNPNSLIADLITLIFEDTKGNIWVSCGNEGISIIPNSFERIRVFDNPSATHRIEDVAVAPNSSVYALTQTHLIVSTYPDYRTEYIPLSTLIPCLNLTPTKLCIGKNNDIYIGTGCGIWRISAQTKSGQLISNIKSEFATQNRDEGFASLHIWSDSVLTFSRYNQRGMYILNLKTKQLQERKDSLYFSPTYAYADLVFQGDMLHDEKGQFWSMALNGLVDMGNFLKQSDIFKSVPFYYGLIVKGYNMNNNAGKALIKIDDNLWWGRMDGGGLSVVSLRDTAYGSYNKLNGLPANSVHCFSQDKNKYLWVGTTLGVSRVKLPNDFRHEKNLFVQNFSAADGLPHNSVRSSAASLRDNKVFLGTSGGLAVINTEGVASDSISPKLVFTNLTILNKIVLPNDSTDLLKTDINETKTLTLQPNQAFFTLEVSGLNFVNPQLTRYAYRLSGLEGDWIDNGFSNIIAFNNMASGNYLLEVKSPNE